VKHDASKTMQKYLLIIYNHKLHACTQCT